MKEASDLTSQFAAREDESTSQCEVVSSTPELPSMPPELLHSLWEASTPIVFMILLCRFFVILTRLIQTCQQEG